MPSFDLKFDMNSIDRTTQRRLIWSVVIIMIALLAISIPRYPIDVDEAWLGEQAYFLAEDGVVRSEMFQGVLQYDTQMFVYHKGFIWLSSLFIAAFGLDLIVLRLVPIICLLLLCRALYRYCREEADGDSFVFMLAILLMCPVFFHGIKIFRPELPVTLAGFVSFACVMNYLKTGHSGRLVVSALFAGLAVLIHLNGLIFPGAGLIVLLFARRWKAVVPFGLIAVAVAMLYVVDIPGHQDVFFMQFRGDPSNAAANADILMPIKNLLAEHKRLFRKPEIVGITILCIVALCFDRSIWRTRRKYVGIYVIAMILLMGFINHNKTVKYSILQFPFFALIIGNFVRGIMTGSVRLPRMKSMSIAIVLVGYGAFGTGYAVYSSLSERENIRLINQELAAMMNPGSRVLAPLSFMFNEIDHFDIRGMLPARIVLEQKGEAFEAESVGRYAAEHDISYLIINDYYSHQLGGENAQANLAACRYEFVDSRDGYQVYRYMGNSQ